MNDDEARRCLYDLLGAFPGAPVTEGTPAAWVEALRPVSFDAGMMAARDLILRWDRVDRLPSIAAFIEIAREHDARVRARDRALPVTPAAPLPTAAQIERRRIETEALQESLRQTMSLAEVEANARRDEARARRQREAADRRLRQERRRSRPVG